MPAFEGVRDTLRQVRYRKPQPVFCPRCRSPRMRTTQTFGILPQRYACSDCGYEGVLVLELEEEKADAEPRD